MYVACNLLQMAFVFLCVGVIYFSLLAKEKKDAEKKREQEEKERREAERRRQEEERRKEETAKVDQLASFLSG